jgi:hypothetical protein
MNRHNISLALLGVAATAALAPASAPAQPKRDVGTPAKARVITFKRVSSPTSTFPSITSANPHGRSRGPGAGAGLL